MADVAHAFLVKADHLEVVVLQKLCYYAWAYGGAFVDAPIFGQSPVAWPSGPVFVELHEFFSPKDAVVSAGTVPGRPLPEVEQRLVDAVFKLYGGYSAQWFINRTVNELPWLEAKARSVQGHAAALDLAVATRFCRALLDAPQDALAYANRFASEYQTRGYVHKAVIHDEI